MEHWIVIDEKTLQIVGVILLVFGITAAASIAVEFASWPIWKRRKSEYTLQFHPKTILYTETVVDVNTDKLRSLLKRYRDETPLGNQPHMIAHEVDQILDEIDKLESEKKIELQY